MALRSASPAPAAHSTRSNASGCSLSGSSMRIDLRPARRSSIRWPTRSARQPCARVGGSSSSERAEFEAIGDQVADVAGGAGEAGGDVRAAADAGERRREELAEQVELRGHRLAAAAGRIRRAALRGRGGCRRPADRSTWRLPLPACMPRIALIVSGLVALAFGQLDDQVVAQHAARAACRAARPPAAATATTRARSPGCGRTGCRCPRPSATVGRVARFAHLPEPGRPTLRRTSAVRSALSTVVHSSSCSGSR